MGFRSCPTRPPWHPDLYQLEVAALLHDIGKIGIPDAILRKEGKLTDEERALMNKHPAYSWSILRLFPGLDKASLYALRFSPPREQVLPL